MGRLVMGSLVMGRLLMGRLVMGRLVMGRLETGYFECDSQDHCIGDAGCETNGTGLTICWFGKDKEL